MTPSTATGHVAGIQDSGEGRLRLDEEAIDAAKRSIEKGAVTNI